MQKDDSFTFKFILISSFVIDVMKNVKRLPFHSFPYTYFTIFSIYDIFHNVFSHEYDYTTSKILFPIQSHVY